MHVSITTPIASAFKNCYIWSYLEVSPTAVSEAKPPPGSKSGLKYPVELNGRCVTAQEAKRLKIYSGYVSDNFQGRSLGDVGFEERNRDNTS
jgi:hypothetical protein